MSKQHNSRKGSGSTKAPMRTSVPVVPKSVSTTRAAPFKERRPASMSLRAPALAVVPKVTTFGPATTGPPSSVPVEVFRVPTNEEESSPKLPLTKRARVVKGKGKVSDWLAPPPSWVVLMLERESVVLCRLSTTSGTLT
ncbi:hypothetical protein RIF29_26124 [Crotalaria pallida]|uniref:Uncharacterized protein n=1 Tax=Crotalaria pallida TaxID=3830 RepID=A0AAN9EUM4_CROPI